MGASYQPNLHSPLTFYTRLAAFEAGSDTPRAYLERCLEVIAARENVVQAWVTLNESGARVQADASTERWRSGRRLSQIDGMPIGIKDLLETKDMPTQLGCAAFAGNFPKRDNAAVWALREAGAVILGKTVTSELGGAHPGPTANPFDLAHTPGGSSSGSAAAVGAGIVPAAIGTQVGGSIIRPASFCANYALKPTQGAINRGERQATSMSTHGPHAGSLEDMWAVAIEVVIRAGGDPGREPLSGPIALPGAHKPSALAVMETEGWSALDDESRTAFEQVVAQLAAAGVQILRRTDSPELESFESALAGAGALAIDITAWENHWLTRNLVAQNPDGVSARGRRVIDVAARVGVDGYRERLHHTRIASQSVWPARRSRRRHDRAGVAGTGAAVAGRHARSATAAAADRRSRLQLSEFAARRARGDLAADGGARIADGNPADGATGRGRPHRRDCALAARRGASGVV